MDLVVVVDSAVQYIVPSELSTQGPLQCYVLSGILAKGVQSQSAVTSRVWFAVLLQYYCKPTTGTDSE